MKTAFKIIFSATVLLALFVLGTNIWVLWSTRKQIISMDSPKAVNSVVLVLGTSKHTSTGGVNPFFEERMKLAAQLYQKGIVQHILVSGDNHTKYYNEPKDMKKALGNLQVPDTVISLDFAGFRTLDSIVRSKKVFGKRSISIITQRFHCYRALFIANHFGIHAYAIPTNQVTMGIKLTIREIFARVLTVLDLYVFDRKPKYLGKQIKLPIH